MRPVRLVLIPAMGLAALALSAPVGAAPPTTPPPPTTTITPGATTTTLAGTPVPTSTIAPVPAPARSGSSIGDLDKGGAEELWTIREMAMVIGSAVGGLAVVGYAYGRIRSSYGAR